MTDRRRKDINWLMDVNPNGSVPHRDAQLAVTMDIRDELKELNRLLNCKNFIDIPRILRDIRRNTTRRKRKVKK